MPEGGGAMMRFNVDVGKRWPSLELLGTELQAVHFSRHELLVCGTTSRSVTSTAPNAGIFAGA
jgi:hypothetical protein